MKIIATVALAGSLVLPATAQQTPSSPQAPSSTSSQQDQRGQPPSPTPDHQASSQQTDGQTFASVDGNRNGSVSITEMRKLNQTFAQADFNKLDTNGNKSLSKQEYAKWSGADTAMKSPGAVSPSGGVLAQESHRGSTSGAPGAAPGVDPSGLFSSGSSAGSGAGSPSSGSGTSTPRPDNR